MRPYSPGGTLRTFAATPVPSEGPTSSVHRLRRGLPGYLILFAPHAFASQRQNRPSAPLSPPAFLSISTHFTAPPRVQAPLPASSSGVCRAVPGLSPGISHDTFGAAYTRFKPSDSEQRLPPLSYRDCWHRVSRGFLWGDSTPGRIRSLCLLAPDSSLHPEGLPPARGVAGSGLRPLPSIRYCSHP